MLRRRSAFHSDTRSAEVREVLQVRDVVCIVGVDQNGDGSLVNLKKPGIVMDNRQAVDDPEDGLYNVQFTLKNGNRANVFFKRPSLMKVGVSPSTQPGDIDCRRAAP